LVAPVRFFLVLRVPVPKLIPEPIQESQMSIQKSVFKIVFVSHWLLQLQSRKAKVKIQKSVFRIMFVSHWLLQLQSIKETKVKYIFSTLLFFAF
jgi:hypothetical protein